ncbi:GntR family transcriptional regulator [Solibacillus silvestris]|uniref:GntR family transcriptional regulator n=1 Tax=Solibacillus silvestris TaxID=76853 RepID=UPI003F7D2161
MSLADKAYEILKKKLVLAEYLPEDVLSENELSSDLSMSRTPIRSALTRLEREGFVSIVKNRGVFVNNITLKEVYEFNDVINSFIIHTIELVKKGNVKLNQLLLEQLLKEIEQAILKEDYTKYMTYYFLFIREIIKTTKNGAMVHIFDETSEKIKWTGIVNHKKNPDTTFYTSFELAKKLFEKIEKNDYEQIPQLLYGHLEIAKKKYMVLRHE